MSASAPSVQTGPRESTSIPRRWRPQTSPKLILLLIGLALALGVVSGINPKIALGIAGALAFIALVVTNYTAAVGVFIVTTFLPLPGTVTKPVGAVLILGWIAIITTREQGSFREMSSDHRGITALLLIFTGWTLIGVIWAYSPSTVLSTLARYIPNFVLFFIMYLAGGRRSSALQLMGWFVLGGAIAGGDAIIHPPSVAAGDLSRTGGTLGDPNYLAAVLVVTLALAGAFLLSRSRSDLIRTGALLSIVISIGGILLSLSRGGLIAMATALAAAVCVARRWRIQMGTLALAVVVVVVGYFAFFASVDAVSRLTTNNQGSGRTDIWRVAIRMWKAHPITGVGAGNFPLVSRNYVLQPGLTTHADYILTVPKVTHNMYLEVLSEGGAPGLILFLAIICCSLLCVRTAWRSFRRSGDREMEMFAYALFAGVLGYLVASFFLSEEYSKQLWTLLAFGPMLQQIATRSAPPPRNVRSLPATA